MPQTAQNDHRDAAQVKRETSVDCPPSEEKLADVAGEVETHAHGHIHIHSVVTHVHLNAEAQRLLQLYETR